VPDREQVEQARVIEQARVNLNHFLHNMAERPRVMPAPRFNVALEARAVEDRHRWMDEAFPAGLPEETGKRGEELFQLLLSGIREIYDTEAVIAGGAVRDLAASVTNHKDIDIFIPLTWDVFQKSFAELGWSGGLLKVKQSKNAYGGTKKGEPGCLFPTLARASSRVQGVPLDLVFMEAPLTKENVETFPVFAQRGIWTLAEGLKLSPQAKTDIDNKQFTIDPTITEKHKVKHVLDKIKGWQLRKDYKDWKVVEPDVKEWWEAKEEMKKDDETKAKDFDPFAFWDKGKI
jgi:hypothetical protein